MKLLTTLGSICCILLIGLLTGCGHKPAPIKEGVIWKVIWAEKPNEETGFYRDKAAPPPGTAGGEYGIDVYGELYPTFLEVRRVGSKDFRSQIIPLSQIVWLEFGDGGVIISKP